MRRKRSSCSAIHEKYTATRSCRTDHDAHSASESLCFHEGCGLAPVPIVRFASRSDRDLDKAVANLRTGAEGPNVIRNVWEAAKHGDATITLRGGEQLAIRSL